MFFSNLNDLFNFQSMLPSSNLSASMLRKSQSSSSISTPYSSKKRSSRSSTIQSTTVSSPSQAHSPFHSPKDEEEEDTPLALRKKLKPKRRSEPIPSTATNPPTSLSSSSAKSTTTLPETTTSQELDQNEPTKKVRGRPKGAKTKAKGQDKKPDHRTRLRSLSSSESGGSSISASSLSSPPETKFKAPASAGVARKSSQPSSPSKKSTKSSPASPNKRLRRAVSASGPPSRDQIKPVHVNQGRNLYWISPGGKIRWRNEARSYSYERELPLSLLWLNPPPTKSIRGFQPQLRYWVCEFNWKLSVNHNAHSRRSFRSSECMWAKGSLILFLKNENCESYCQNAIMNNPTTVVQWYFFNSPC